MLQVPKLLIVCITTYSSHLQTVIAFLKNVVVFVSLKRNRLKFENHCNSNYHSATSITIISLTVT